MMTLSLVEKLKCQMYNRRFDVANRVSNDNVLVDHFVLVQTQVRLATASSAYSTPSLTMASISSAE